jgi:hypothetical protein
VIKKQFFNDNKFIFIPNDLAIKILENIEEIKKPKILLRDIKIKQPETKKKTFFLLYFFNVSLFL